MKIDFLTKFIDLKELEGKGEWNFESLSSFSSQFYSLIFIQIKDEIEILAYSKTNPGKFIRNKDCLEYCDTNYFLKLILNRSIVCREWYYQNKLYMITFHDSTNNDKIIFKRLESWINIKELINIKLATIFEIGFVVTSSESVKEFNLF